MFVRESHSELAVEKMSHASSHVRCKWIHLAGANGLPVRLRSACESRHPDK